jgi:hypothetical protein
MRMWLKVYRINEDEAAQQLTLDRVARAHFFRTMQRRIRDAASLLPLAYDEEYIAIDPALHGF